MQKIVGVFTKDKELAETIRVKGDRGDDKPFGSLYLPASLVGDLTEFKVTIEPVATK